MNCAILLRPEHRDLAGSLLGRQLRRAGFLEALDAFLNALQPIEGALQAILCGATDRRARWFFTALEFRLEGSAHDAWLSGFGVT